MWSLRMGNGVCVKQDQRALPVFMIRNRKPLNTREELPKHNRLSFTSTVVTDAFANAIPMETIRIHQRADDCQLLLKNASLSIVHWMKIMSQFYRQFYFAWFTWVLRRELLPSATIQEKIGLKKFKALSKIPNIL